MSKRRTQDDFPETGVVTPPQLNMRATPGGKVIRVLTKDTTVVVLRGREPIPWTIGKERSGGNQTALYWLKVEADGDVGYVMLDWITFPNR